MKIKSIKIPCFLLAGAIATIAGCAVMRVDVDVYKGPMANHEEVQAEQMASMAIGAKPLLIELRDQLELYRLGYKTTASLRDVIGPMKYDTGCKQPGDLWDNGAIRVNAILSLYDDSCDSELAPFIQRGKNELENYCSAWKKFTANPKGSWEALEKDMMVVGDNKDMQKDAAIQELKKAYKIFLNPAQDEKKNKQRNIVAAHTAIFNYMSDPAEFAPIKIFGSYKNVGTDTASESANAIFGALANKKLVEEHAKILFNNKNKKQQELFVERVTSIAQGFIDARQALSGLFRTTLEALVVFGDKKTPQKDAAIKFAVNLIQPTYFKAVLNPVTNGFGSQTTKGQVLCDALMKSYKGVPLKDVTDEFLKLCLVENLEKDTSFTASALLEADNYFKSKSNLLGTLTTYKNIGIEEQEEQADELSKRGKNPGLEMLELTTPKKREYGIVAVPIIDIDDAYKLADSFDAIARSSAVGLEKGRLNDGIDTLTKNYLEATARKYKHGDDNSVEGARRQLVDTLIHFSEKVLVIANNKALLNMSVNVPNIDTISNRLDTYTLVLQSIGNSILIQADELRNQGSYKKKIEDNKNQEARAIASAFSENPIQYLNDIVYDIKARKDTAEKNMDEITSKLKSELANCLSNASSLKDKYFGTQTAKALTVNDFGTQTATYKTIIEGALNSETGNSKKYSETKTCIRDTLYVINKYREKFTTPENKEDTDTKVKEKIKQVLTTISSDPQIPSADKKMFGTTTAYLEESESLKKTPALTGNSKDILDTFVNAFQEDMKNNDKKMCDTDSNIENIKKITSLMQIAIKEFTDAKSTADKYGAVVETINGARNDLIPKVGNTNDIPTSTAVYSRLLKTLQDKIVTKSSPNELASDEKTSNNTLRRAIEVLTEMKPIEKVTIDTEGAHNSKDAFDQLLATLRERHLSAIVQLGADAPLTKQYSDAIERAYNYRSGMVYIRPPSAYLRSSTPATSLQADPGIGWQNMLTEHAWSNLPFYGNLKKHNERAKTVAEIDKQYWQNINSVRVAGAGRTNYVIAKDDVGNWYVKRYSSDPKDIINSAKKLAMFNMGSQMNMNLVNRITAKDGMSSGTQQSTQQTAAQQNNEANRSTLERLFDKHKDVYGKKTSAAFVAVKTKLEPKQENGVNKISEVEDAVLKSWANSKDIIDSEFLPVLNSNLSEVGASTLRPTYTELVTRETELTENLNNKKITADEVVSTKANEIINASNSIQQFQLLLADRIPRLGLTGTATTKQTSAKTDWDAKKKELNELNTSLEDLKKALEEANKAFSTNEQELATKELAVAKKEQEVSDKDKEVKSATDAEKAGKQSELDTLNNQLSTLKGERDTLKKGLDSARGFVNAKTQDIANKEKEITAKEEQVRGCEKAVSDAEQNVKHAEAGVTFAQKEVTRIVLGVLAGLVSERLDTVDDYESGVLFIGDAIKENK